MHAHAQERVPLYAAGSLRAALDEVARAFTEAKVEAVYGASGLLRERIAKGEPGDRASAISKASDVIVGKE